MSHTPNNRNVEHEVNYLKKLTFLSDRTYDDVWSREEAPLEACTIQTLTSKCLSGSEIVKVVTHMETETIEIGWVSAETQLSSNQSNHYNVFGVAPSL